VSHAASSPERAALQAVFPLKGEAHSGPPVLAVSIEGACRALGVSWDYWREHIEPEVRIVRRGRRKLVPVAELEKWLDEAAERALPGTYPGPATKALQTRGRAPGARQPGRGREAGRDAA